MNRYLTTVFGMLPLILFPGAGSEFYRGLIMSTVFTIFLIPALPSLSFDAVRVFKKVELGVSLEKTPLNT